MRRSTRVALFTVMAVALTIPMAAHSAERSETKSYFVGTDGAPLCAPPEVPEQVGHDNRVGGACFYLIGDELEATIEVHDVTGLPIGGAYVFSQNGSKIGTEMFYCGSATTTIPAGADRLVVYVGGPIAGPAACLLQTKVGGPGTTGEIEVTYQLGSQTGPPVVDVERECLEPVPAAVSVAGLTDDNQTIDLAVKVLLDGVDQSSAEAVFAKAAESYAPLGIDLRVIDYTPVNFTGKDAFGLITQSKIHFAWERPAGSDIVYTLTNKNINVGGDMLEAAAGLADCVGGVRYAHSAFAVGENLGQIDAGPFKFNVDGAAKVAGHEIGHLMGAQHHYANCVEGHMHLENGEITPCSLMFNSLDFMSLNFDTVNGAVVRGHSVDFASP